MKFKILLIFLLIVIPVDASFIYVNNSKPVIANGSISTSYINVTPIANISGMQTKLIYNTSVISIISISEGNLFNRRTVSYFNNRSWVLGIITEASSTNLPGTFAEIKYLALSPGNTTISLDRPIVALPSGIADSIVKHNSSVITVINKHKHDFNFDFSVDIFDLMLSLNYPGTPLSDVYDSFSP